MFQISSSDQIQLLILCAILVQGIIALVSFRNQRKLENCRATFSALHQLTENVSEAGGKVYAHYAEGGYSFEHSSKEQELNLLRYLDYLEDIAVGVNMGVYDIDIVNRVMGTQIIMASVRFDYFIEGIRRKQGSDNFYKDMRLLRQKILWLREVDPIVGKIESEKRNFLERHIRRSGFWVAPK
ncbi:DUF4760 domain-containing protein [Sulfitobacter pacificus]|uniref:Uncharacterized protein n=1 Tax=Sulfitobacter pacificus TaxID=1499314 RepID=A0ABQ5VJG8_9RHOB|nr:DUF4760 domain-containing protein [Sulfitobacter pacificus]GLQ27265.1 hypothetical protein GCM10007927_20680 [Sulfitobacter pacificus]